MGVIQTQETVVHPEGKILLVNGNIIDGYRKSGVDTVTPSKGFQLDTTGEFFQVGRKKKRKEREVESPYKRSMSFLIANAWELYRRREEIYADSRMFLAPLDVGCNIAYTGTSGIADATLGVWLEWWESLDMLRKDEKGNERLVYYFAGSPLSGTNRCKAVTPAGKTVDVSFCPFSPVWSTFMKINSRYDAPKQLYEAYSFEQTLEKIGLQTII